MTELCCKSKLCQDILLCGVAVQGIVLGGNIEAIKGLDMLEIILHMEAVHLLRSALHPEVFSSVMAGNYKAIFRIMGDLAFTQRNKLPAPGEAVYIHFILKEIRSLVDLLFNIFPFSVIPVRHMGKLRFALQRLQAAVLLQIPPLATGLAENFCTLGVHF